MLWVSFKDEYPHMDGFSGFFKKSWSVCGREGIFSTLNIVVIVFDF